MIPAFSAAILRQCVTQVVGVIHADGRDHGDLRLIDVGGIPAAPHSRLDHCHIDRSVGETRVSESGDHLEHGHQRATLGHRLGVDHLEVRLDLPVGLHEALRGDRLAVQFEPFGEIA